MGSDSGSMPPHLMAPGLPLPLSVTGDTLSALLPPGPFLIAPACRGLMLMTSLQHMTCVRMRRLASLIIRLRLIIMLSEPVAMPSQQNCSLSLAMEHVKALRFPLGAYMGASC